MGNPWRKEEVTDSAIVTRQILDRRIVLSSSSSTRAPPSGVYKSPSGIGGMNLFGILKITTTMDLASFLEALTRKS